jgi:SulP family sulfate permease
MVVAWNISKKEQFAKVVKEKSFHSLVLLTTFSLTVFTNLTIGIAVGLCLSGAHFMIRKSKEKQKLLRKTG